MTAIRWLLLLVSIVVYRVWFPEQPPPAPMRLDYDLFVIAMIGLYRGMRTGTIAGWVIGFLAYATDPGRLGWATLMGASLGWSVGFWKERLFLEYALSRWLVLWLVFVAYKLAFILLISGGDWAVWLGSLWSGVLASTGLTATMGAALSVMWDRTRPRRARLSGASADDAV